MISRIPANMASAVDTSATSPPACAAAGTRVSTTTNAPLSTTIEHGFSNTNVCYYILVNVLLGDLVTHLVSITLCGVTIV
jgi:hypothetical protein